MPKAKEVDDKPTKTKTKTETKPAVKKTKATVKPAKEQVNEVVEAKSSDVDTKAEAAKAGKRSRKSLEAEEAKLAKELKKAQPEVEEVTTETKPKNTQKPARSKLERKSKGYRERASKIDKSILYDLDQAVGLITKTSPTKFDATVELHVRLGVDPRQAEQNVRGVVSLPSGSGKTVKVAVFADGPDLEAAKKAGADIAKGDEFLQQLDKELVDFDVLVATPAMMPKLGKYAKFLGPRGLMPNPKNNTVTTNIAKAITELKAGRVDYRIDSGSIIHIGVGKVSFGDKKLKDNLEAVFTSIKSNKPASFKGNFVRSVYLTTTMGPSIPLDKSPLS